MYIKSKHQVLLHNTKKMIKSDPDKVLKLIISKEQSFNSLSEQHKKYLVNHIQDSIEYGENKRKIYQDYIDNILDIRDF